MDRPPTAPAGCVIVADASSGPSDAPTPLNSLPQHLRNRGVEPLLVPSLAHALAHVTDATRMLIVTRPAPNNGHADAHDAADRELTQAVQRYFPHTAVWLCESDPSGPRLTILAPATEHPRVAGDAQRPQQSAPPLPPHAAPEHREPSDLPAASPHWRDLIVRLPPAPNPDVPGDRLVSAEELAMLLGPDPTAPDPNSPDLTHEPGAHP